MSQAIDQPPVPDRIVRAAEACFEHYGVPKTTIDDIASAAGVSRSTVYRYFPGGRDDLIVTVVMSDAQAFIAENLEPLAAESTIADAIVSGVMRAVDFVSGRPSLAQMFSPDSVGHTALVASAGTAMLDMVTTYLRPVLEVAQSTGDIRADLDPEVAAEALLRMLLSLLSVSGMADRDPDATARFLHAALVPVFVPDHVVQAEGVR